MSDTGGESSFGDEGASPSVEGSARSGGFGIGSGGVRVFEIHAVGGLGAGTGFAWACCCWGGSGMAAFTTGASEGAGQSSNLGGTMGAARAAVPLCACVAIASE